MKGVRVNSLALLLAAAFSLTLPCASSAEVKAWEGTITIPTYGWEEDINPKLWALEGQVKFSTTVKGSIVYPYTMQDHLSRTKVGRTYKALFLENEYLKVTCLPELGGRLHSVLDKTDGQGDVPPQPRDQAEHDRDARGLHQRRRRVERRAAGAHRHDRLAGRCSSGRKTRTARRIWRSATWRRPCGPAGPCA